MRGGDKEKMNFHRHKSKLLWFIVTIAVLAGAAGIFQYNITKDKRTVAECLQNENMVMIIERYDTTEYIFAEPLVYGADEAYFPNAFSAAKVMSQENFKPLSTEDKDTLLAYLKNVQYRLKRNNERSSGMSKIADTYWIYITTFKDSGESDAWLYFSLSKDMKASFIDSPQISRFIGLDEDFSAYLENLFTE